MIIIWNSAKLARKLRDDDVSERQKFAYYFIIFFFISLISARSFSTYTDTPFTVHDYVIDGISVFAFVIGTLLIFRTNQSGDGRNFIERAICLTFPVSLQTVLLILIFYLGTALYKNISLLLVSGGPDPQPMTDMRTSALDTAFVAAAFFYYYYRMTRSIGIASGARAAKKE